jgi:pimeloyl-ACP methyl ester carboxylesterase
MTRFDDTPLSGKLLRHPACWLRSLQASVLPLVFLGLSLGIAAAQPPGPHDHVYLLRGAFNIFSLGLDQMADSLERQGVPVTIANHMAWSSLADQAAAEYKNGQVRNIILVGHSSGAVAVTEMAARLGQLGVPVKLAIGLDPSTRMTASGTVGRYVNYWVPGGLGTVVDRGPQFNGVLQNIDLRSSDIGHFSIDKNHGLQQRVLTEIRAAL